MTGVPGIVVGVEVDDADVLLAVDIRESRHVGELDRVVAPDDDRDGARLRDLAHHAADGRHAALHAQVVDGRVAVINRREFAPPRHHRLHAAHAAPHGSERGWPLARPAESHPHVDRSPHEGDLDLARDEILDRARDRQPEEREHGSDLDRSGFAGRSPGDVAIAPDREVGVARVEADDGGVGGEGLPLGVGGAWGSVGRGVGDGVGRRTRGRDFRRFPRRRLAGRQQQEAREESGGGRAGCHGFHQRASISGHLRLVPGRGGAPPRTSR